MKDILLHIDSYPEPTPDEAIDQAVRFAAVVGGRLTALAVQVDLQAPSNWLADRLINLSGLCAEQETKSLAACRAALATFESSLAKHQVTGEGRVMKADFYLVGDHVALQARTRDLCLVPTRDRLDGQRAIAEAVVFGSGRPVLLYPTAHGDWPDAELNTAVLAWDGSRSAARAMADAIPVLLKARQVRVLTVTNDKPDARPGIGNDAVRHLKVYGIDAVADEVDGARRKTGQVFAEYAAQHGADLFVMGAFGRSRVREFILGGATEYMLDDPKTPLLLSH